MWINKLFKIFNIIIFNSLLPLTGVAFEATPKNKMTAKKKINLKFIVSVRLYFCDDQIKSADDTDFVLLLFVPYILKKLAFSEASNLYKRCCRVNYMTG